jgi:hypothetical protein
MIRLLRRWRARRTYRALLPLLRRQRLDAEVAMWAERRPL